MKTRRVTNCRMRRSTRNGLRAALFSVLLLASGARAQWEPDRRLTYDDSTSTTSYNCEWCVGTDDDMVHVVWCDYRDGRNFLFSEIYYKRSNDGGATWGADVRLTDDTVSSFDPCIAVSGSDVHVAWWCSGDSVGEYTVRYMHSTNTGLTWSATCRLAGSEYTYSPVPSIAATGSAVHLAWSKSHQVYHKCSYDRGFTWGPDMRLVSDSASSDGACVAASASDVHVVWERVTGLMDEIEVWHARSTDLGATWSAPVQLSQAEDWSMAPCVGVSGSSVHVVWQDNRGPLPGLFYARSTDRGATWNTPAAITQHPTVTLPSIAVSGSVVHLIWPDVPTPRDVNTEVYYRRSVNGGQTWGPETRLTSDTAWSEQPSVAVAGSRVHVVWEDERDGNDEIYYKRNPTGNAPGIEEQAATPADRQRSPATVVRGTLRLPAVDAGDEESPVLLDAAGRRVIDLYPGPNDLSRLAPGVYFCRLRADDGNRTVKLVLQQ